MIYWYVLLAIAAGAALPAQVGVNNSLRVGIGNGVLAALISFAIGSVVLFIYAICTRAAWPSMQALSKLPVWVWSGGILGAYYVATSIFVAPRLGAANLVGLVVAAQILTSLVLDHYGFVGFAQHSINAPRVAGALLLVVGAVLIVRN